MRTLDEILKDLKIIKYQSYFKNAMKQAQLEILDELERRFDTNNTGKDIWDFIYELKEELK